MTDEWTNVPSARDESERAEGHSGGEMPAGQGADDGSVAGDGGSSVADNGAAGDTVMDGGVGTGASPPELTAPEFSITDVVAAIEKERDEMREIALRLQADFENYRKRVSTQQADEVARATGKMAESLLPVLDACEAAFLNHPAEVEPLFNVLLGTLRKEGLEAMNLQDQPFDPAVAEAVIHEPADDAGEPTVTEVLRTGYTWKGRVLRPAMVKVRG
jgi:molecular chaperone GrpE